MTKNLIAKLSQKLGTKGFIATQDYADFGKNAAFRAWQRKLNRGDRLPRGKFFKGKRAGKPLVIMDEGHLLTSHDEYKHLNEHTQKLRKQMRVALEKNSVS